MRGMGWGGGRCGWVGGCGEWWGGVGWSHLTSAMKLSKQASSGLKKPSVFNSPIGFWWKPSCCQVITYRARGGGARQSSSHLQYSASLAVHNSPSTTVLVIRMRC